MHNMVRRAVDASDPDLRKDLYSNIVVVGGNTNFPGLLSLSMLACLQRQSDRDRLTD